MINCCLFPDHFIVFFFSLQLRSIVNQAHCDDLIDVARYIHDMAAPFLTVLHHSSIPIDIFFFGWLGFRSCWGQSALVANERSIPSILDDQTELFAMSTASRRSDVRNGHGSFSQIEISSKEKKTNQNKFRIGSSALCIGVRMRSLAAQIILKWKQSTLTSQFSTQWRITRDGHVTGGLLKTLKRRIWSARPCWQLHAESIQLN